MKLLKIELRVEFDGGLQNHDRAASDVSKLVVDAIKKEYGEPIPSSMVRVINADYYFCEAVDGRKED